MYAVSSGNAPAFVGDSSGGSPYQLLIVDGDPLRLDAIGARLRALGFGVTSATAADDGPIVVPLGDVDAVISICTPEPLYALGAGRGRPIVAVALSPAVDRGWTHGGAGGGGRAPLQAADLVRAVRDALDGFQDA